MTYDGVSLRSKATYNTSINFCLNGSPEFQSDCVNNNWTPLPVITYGGEVEVILVYLYNLLYRVSMHLPQNCPTHCISTVCGVDELLTCNDPTDEGRNALCCDSTLCVAYDGNTVGSVATYSTFDDFCIEDENELMRRYNEDLEWEGSIPTVTRG